MACVLHLLDLGVEPGKIELHHHDVDGRHAFMDWPITGSYCQAVAKALRLPIYFSWKEGGFLREMMRENSRTAPILFETIPGIGQAGGELGKAGGNRGKESTRKRFPQVSADLSVRWCSAYLKIDVLAALIRNSERFLGSRTLVITGERAQESSARSRYAAFEPHRADTRLSSTRYRHIDAWRPIHAWSENQVWEIIRRHGIRPHPAYQIGWGRLSCMSCIFGSPNQWATIAAIAQRHFDRIALYEKQSGSTIQRTRSIKELAARGKPYAAALENPEIVELALSHEWKGPILIGSEWTLPAGAFGESTGPT